MLELARVRRELEIEEQRLEETRAELQRLEARRDSLANDSATIERIARERYGLVRPGERLYRFVDSIPAADSLPPDTAR